MTLLADLVTNIPVPFRQMRYMLRELGIIESVGGSADLLVSQRAAGANMSVDVAAGDCWVNIDTGTRNGIVHVNNDAVANVPVGANASGNPRLDQLVVQYNDTSIPAGVGGNVPTLRVVAGSPAAGATLANRLGAASLPSDALRLADILVANGAVSILNASIQDRRALAFGQRVNKRGTSGTATTLSSVMAVVPEMTVTGEFGGRAVLLDFTTTYDHSAGGPQTQWAFFRDGVQFGTRRDMYMPSSAAGQWSMPFAMVDMDTPVAGQHTYDVRWANTLSSSRSFNDRCLRVIELPTF